MRSPRKIQHLHGPSFLAEVDDEAAPNSPTTGAVGELLESLTTVRALFPSLTASSFIGIRMLGQGDCALAGTFDGLFETLDTMMQP